MATETTQFINVETSEDKEVRETIEDITKEPDINDHISGNGEAEDLEDNEPSQAAPEENGKPEGNGKAKTKAEGREEKFKRVVIEAIEEITPVFQQAVTLTHEQRDRYREIGLIFNRKRDEVASTYGTKLIGVIADHFAISVSSLRDMSDYAKVDPYGEAIPSTLINLSWRRVGQCAKRAKEEKAFTDFLNSHPDLVTLGSDEFDKLLRNTFPKQDTRGRKRKGEGLNTNDAQNQANGLGGDGQTSPPPESKSHPLPPRVEKAFNDLVNEDDSPWKGEVNVYSGEDGCFEFQATFKTEAECVTVFKHFITNLEEEAA